MSSGNNSLIKIFYHICAINNWEDVVYLQMTKILYSPLWDICHKIYITISGEFSDECENFLKEYMKTNKIEIIEKKKDDKSYERLMLLNIKKHIKPEDKILYIHTKGITKPDSKPVKDWRDLMEYFCIKKSIDCIKLLNFHMVVGCKFQGYPKPHFSGNFWWCRGDYYLTLSDEIDDDYFAPEFYICSKLTNSRQIYSFHNTAVQLYCERYSLSKYLN